MCLNPIYAVDRGILKSNGKKLIKLLPHLAGVPGDYDYLKSIYGDCLIQLPCGHCSECCKSYAKTWSVRCMLESLYHKEACFVTLTYDNEHLPPAGMLVKSDLQKFFKRLRALFPEKEIRYFACGEYGGQTSRPHYHAIIFGLDFPEDKRMSQIVGTNELKQQVYRSARLEAAWKFGLSSFGEVTPESCAYVARYSLKKRIDFSNDGSFILMSRKPGIGQQFFLDKKQLIYLSDRVYSQKIHGVSVPRYFDKLAENDPQIATLFTKAKDKRLARQSQAVYSAMHTTGSLSIEEANLKQEIRNWTRALCLLRR